MKQDPVAPHIVYKYCDLRGVDLRVKITPPNQFNDLFELAPRMEPNLTSEQASAPLRDREILQHTYDQLIKLRQFQGTFEAFVAFLQSRRDHVIADLIAA